MSDSNSASRRTRPGVATACDGFTQNLSVATASAGIQPMLTMGSITPVMWDDNWTVVTQDGSLSAQFEHTILITQDGAEILTKC